MKRSHQSIRAYPAGRLLPKAKAPRAGEWHTRTKGTSVQYGVDKHIHARKTRQWFARYIRELLCELCGE